DTKPVLAELGRHYRLGIVTDAQRVFLEAELRETGLEGMFDVMVVSSDLGYRKPDRRMFAPALAAFGARPEEAVYVGDSLERDVGGARAAGLTGVWLDRQHCGTTARGDGVPVITSLAQLEVTPNGG
ncbi:MAG: HAD family hydrolase, partial [Actinomycetota bacterium]